MVNLQIEFKIERDRAALCIAEAFAKAHLDPSGGGFLKEIKCPETGYKLIELEDKSDEGRKRIREAANSKV